MIVSNNKKTKRRIVFRLSPVNRLSFPVLLNAWEQNHIDKEFEIIVREQPLSPTDIQRNDVFLYSFMTPDLPFVHEEIKKIKEAGKKDVLIAAGGPHVTGEQELAVKMGFGTLFIGAGEGNFLRFGMDLLDNHPIKNRYPDQYETQEKNKKSPYTDNDFNNHLPLSKYLDTIPPLEIMRGCRWNCNYCGTQLHDVRFRDITSIGTYLRQVKKRKAQRVNFISPSSMEYGEIGRASCRERV